MPNHTILRSQLRASALFARTDSTSSLPPSFNGTWRAVQTLADGGQTVDEALMRHLSPRELGHINLTGDYVWRLNKPAETGTFRPLRRASDPLTKRAIQSEFSRAPLMTKEEALYDLVSGCGIFTAQDAGRFGYSSQLIAHRVKVGNFCPVKNIRDAHVAARR
jgi:Tn3 transposase DDE domain